MSNYVSEIGAVLAGELWYNNKTDNDEARRLEWMETVFKSSRRLAVYQGMLWGVRVWAAGAVLYGLTAWFIEDIFRVVWLLIALLGALLAGAVLGVLRSAVTVTIDQDAVTIIGHRNYQERFQIADNDFGTMVENQTVFGFVYNIKRYLKINDKLYLCYCFSRRIFSQLNARIQQVKNDGERQILESEDYSGKEYFGQEIFWIPRMELLQKERRRILKIGLESLGVAAILVIAWLFSTIRRMEPVISAWLTGAAIVVGVLLCIPVVTELFRYRKYQKTLPENIIFQKSMIKVDGREFHLGEVEMICMTPASYTRAGQYSVRRSLTIVSGTDTVEYSLGYTQFKELQYQDYERLLETIEEACRFYQITFVLEL